SPVPSSACREARARACSAVTWSMAPATGCSRSSRKAGLTPDDVTLVNTPPPDMTVGLLAKGIDAFSGWDPWPIVALKEVPGAVEIIRGGDVIAYLGFNVGLRPWVTANGDTVEKFLAAVSEADKWMRANPKQAAAVATRWIPGLKAEVAETAMQFNI